MVVLRPSCPAASPRYPYVLRKTPERERPRERPSGHAAHLPFALPEPAQIFGPCLSSRPSLPLSRLEQRAESRTVSSGPRTATCRSSDDRAKRCDRASDMRRIVHKYVPSTSRCPASVGDIIANKYLPPCPLLADERQKVADGCRKRRAIQRSRRFLRAKRLLHRYQRYRGIIARRAFFRPRCLSDDRSVSRFPPNDPLHMTLRKLKDRGGSSDAEEGSTPSRSMAWIRPDNMELFLAAEFISEMLPVIQRY